MNPKSLYIVSSIARGVLRAHQRLRLSPTRVNFVICRSEHADPPHALRLLRAATRPRRRAA
jgi:hypothetical protein